VKKNLLAARSSDKAIFWVLVAFFAPYNNFLNNTSGFFRYDDSRLLRFLLRDLGGSRFVGHGYLSGLLSTAPSRIPDRLTFLNIKRSEAASSIQNNSKLQHNTSPILKAGFLALSKP
jgi:hypothetical protein